MPPVRIREHSKAQKGTIKRLLKDLFRLYPVRLVVVGICIIFNVIANLTSSTFAGLISGVLTATLSTQWANGEALNPFDIHGSYEASAFGGSITIKSNVTILLIIMGTIYTIGVITAWWSARSMAIITQEYQNAFRKKMFNHMQDLPIRYFDTHAHGDIMSIYTNDVDTIRQFISQSVPEFLRTSLSVLFTLTMMLLNSIYMTIVVLVGAFAMFMNTKIIGGRSARYFRKQQMQIGAVEGNIQESIKGLKVIKVFSHEEKSCEEFDQMNETLRDYSTEANIHGNITMPINGNIGNIMYVLTAIVGCLIYIACRNSDFKNLTILGLYHVDSTAFYAMLVSFLLLCRMFTNNVSQFSQQITFIVMGMAGASRCYALLDEEIEKDEGYVTLVNVIKHKDGTLEEVNYRTHDYAWKHPHKADGTITYTELKGDIVLTDVDFGYVPDKIVLHNVSIYAHPGQKIAFVGATGAGKTTITNLINRFYDIADGKIRYDGININKIKKDDLRRSLGIVLQDTNLFTGTVMENIRYGNLDATDEEVYEAAKIANAYDFITRLPEGFNTMLTGDGSNLSQGQRQLLSIARAAVANAPVMILDEATSSIDTRTEKLVQEGTDKLMEGRTVFVIAHRLSTVQNSDAIMVLDHGHIIERGSHDDLIKEHGMYYQLYTGAVELE